jgi:methylglutaconyl-CoA hydratase
MSFQTLELAFDSRIAIITFNRPEKRNALSFQMIGEILAALDEIEKTHAQNVDDSRQMANLFRRLYDFPKPTIAAVNGAAIAGGTGIATMCDFTLAVPEAKFGYTEVRIGFVPAIVSSILVWQVGHKIARDLLLTGRIFDANEAHRLGLVNDVVTPDNLIKRARQLAEEIMQNSPTSVRLTKKLINGFIGPVLDRQIEQAVEENAAIRQTADFREGVSAFLEKRKPRWSGQ